MDNLLQIKDLSVNIENKQVLNGVSLNINAGEKETKNCLTVSGTVVSTAFLGQTTRCRIRLNNETSQILTADLPTEDEDLPSGQKITLKIEKYLLKK